MTEYNLLRERWLPIRRKSGISEYVAPWQITESKDPPVALAAPRADFNGALAQFWIGLLQTVLAPAGAEEWAERFESPPAPETLRAASEIYADAFNLVGDGSRFMQDIDPLASASLVDIGSLLIEMPGGNTLKNNADHFVKRGGVAGMCPSCAATALFTLQINAPSGGVGHRTGLRGGGPLTTLLLADPNNAEGFKTTLWHDLWLNVLPNDGLLTGNLSKNGAADIFPWLGATRTSEKISGRETTPEDAHPLQMYWSMPRRIRLEPDATEAGTCDVCGRASHGLISSYRTKNYGINYAGAWHHPLSPYYIDKKQQELPLHAQPGGISYRHWLTLGYVSNPEAGGTHRALNVQTCMNSDRLVSGEQLRLWAFGYDMDNMKARCWYEAVMPLYVLTGDRRDAFLSEIDRMLKVAVNVAQTLKARVRDAWFDGGEEVRGDMSFIPGMFYERTESAFYRSLHEIVEGVRPESGPRARWLKAVQHAAQAIFDEQATSDAFVYGDPRRVAIAHTRLYRYLHGAALRKDLGLVDIREVA